MTGMRASHICFGCGVDRLAWAGLLAGAMIGRPLALRAILPPRLVGAFARLWLCDGLAPPGGR